MEIYILRIFTVSANIGLSTELTIEDTEAMNAGTITSSPLPYLKLLKLDQLLPYHLKHNRA